MQQRIVTLKRLVLSLVVATVFLAAGKARAQGQKPDCFVLSVGIDKYTNGPLQGCVNDAKNMAQVFNGQKGKMFGQVKTTVLLDQEGSRARIGQELERIKKSGKAGDFMVVFLSGHGGNGKPAWYFVPQDHAGKDATKLTDGALLNAAESMAGQGKKVFIIIDACFAGQLRVNAREQLNKNYPKGGGVIVMVSSMPSQTSAAMGRFSAFAQAVFEGLSGHADFDGDGFITLREVRRFAYHRVHDMQAKGEQDGEIDYSLSISENMKVAAASKPKGSTLAKGPNAGKPNPGSVVPVGPGGQFGRLANTVWQGKEDLQGFGNLEFRFQSNASVLMIDADGTTPGTWTQNGNQITLQFNNGRTTYTGTIQGNQMTGTARNSSGQPWAWTVVLQGAVR